jgi:hypothetical protein
LTNVSLVSSGYITFHEPKTYSVFPLISSAPIGPTREKLTIDRIAEMS